MEYSDGSCTWEDLVENKAFTIERHALKVTQPLVGSKNDGNVQLNCVNPDGSRRFGRMGMSHDSFPFWYLSHIDFHVPSEHTQNGKRYSAEAHIFHLLPPGDNSKGYRSQIFSPTIFFEAYEDAAPYGFLDKLICQWRQAEDDRRAECGLPSITTNYPGCFPLKRSNDTLSSTRREQEEENRNLRWSSQDEPSNTISSMGNRLWRWLSGGQSSEPENTEQKRQLPTQRQQHENEMERHPFSALDVAMRMHHHGDNATWKLAMDPSDFRPKDDIDWDEFVKTQYENEEKVRQRELDQGHRQLINYEHVGPWNNYFLMIGVKTEYYLRYLGSQTFPPCFGPNTHANANATHFRVLKDPIRVHPRQIAEMERLLAHRIAPPDDDHVACQPDTAGEFVDGNPDRVSVARPLQYVTGSHNLMFCDCPKWYSHWEEDHAWCQITDNATRWFEQPYNFKTKGF